MSALVTKVAETIPAVEPGRGNPALLLIGLCGGSRCGELAALQWAHVAKVEWERIQEPGREPKGP